MTGATSRASNRHLNKGYAIALTGTAVWSTTAIFIRYLSAPILLGVVLVRVKT